MRRYRTVAIILLVGCTLAGVDSRASTATASSMFGNVEWAVVPNSIVSIEPPILPSSGQIAATSMLHRATLAINQAHLHGLQPSDYGIEELHALLGHLLTDRASIDEVRYAEEYAHRAMLGYALDLKFGHQHATTVQIDGLRAELNPAIAAGPVTSWVDTIVPTHRAYRNLQARLSELRALRTAGAWPLIGTGPTLQPNSIDERVVRLRMRLGLIRPTSGVDVFDEALSREVERYQNVHGLTADGKVGKRTLHHLDVSIDARIEQVKVNLKRWRQMPVPSTSTYVHVNIPEYQLEFVRQGQENLSMRVIVGDKENPTPSFTDSIEYLVFSPYWNVPRKIAMRELLPRIARDPAYLAAENFEIVSADGVISPDGIDFELANSATFPYKLRQKPGNQNALGLVKFIFPNDYSVYLHDTPADYLFEGTQRALSHGCVRVEYPEQLAAAILANVPTWPTDRIRSAMHGKKPNHVTLAEPIPVLITYFTAGSTVAGQVRFFDDVYERDGENLGPLASARLAPFPVPQSVRVAALARAK
jgi:murein L,D-transpeptidase YcbB/YkuD